jgi:hypothetical protein
MNEKRKEIERERGEKRKMGGGT